MWDGHMGGFDQLADVQQRATSAVCDAARRLRDARGNLEWAQDVQEICRRRLPGESPASAPAPQVTSVGTAHGDCQIKRDARVASRCALLWWN